ncbi:uncharacterized protein LOC110857246 isoform X2 [Folsomia candida]|nr:uncharacterized protein LOC110857246 isoform X2 [Folsomia candida]XP_035713695.1 uncharacterized protein LOC110857246 isoform X2 [Folsomia candida]XP_035713696.1 uncharacterized protein LOC110857246 isoform X2 [Folsomia candida]XP_035713697.1 uncharacterized protein LOC110857246 isoform X2 [Folsomia candida]XP_035713698.1 uncharacterized protein LOC110857246 isoform X2 [Folsomia candida]XP_035713699.1 uncharacterized protein LOC110857246 isoform X2 [Folsomia candida]
MKEELQISQMRQAIQNPIILQCIFQNKSVPGKTLRLVCHLWNEIVLSLPQPKLTLRFSPLPSRNWWLSTHSDCSTDIPFKSFCENMEPKLARCIGEDPCLSNRCPAHQKICTAETKLLYVSEHFSPTVVDLTVTFAGEDVIPTLYKILKNYCPNLKRLKICVQRTTHDPLRLGSPDALVPFSLRPKLTSVEIHDFLENSRFLEMTQLILNSASKLTRLIYRGKYFPDLSQHLALKSITLDMDKLTTKNSPTGSGVHGLNKMLDQVKDRLEFLHILGTHENEESPLVDFHLPRMKNLKEFRNNLLDLFNCGDRLQDICSARIPTLETLEIFKWEDSLDDLLQNIKEEKGLFSGVKNLHLSYVDNPESIIGLRTAFPSLEVLSIQQLHLDDVITEVGPHLRACASLGLKYLDLGLANHHRQLSKFLQGFSNCGKLVPGLQNLEMRLVSVYDDLKRVADGTRLIKQFLLKMRGLEDVTISGILWQEETWKWMMSFIDKNKIPIKFDT